MSLQRAAKRRLGVRDTDDPFYHPKDKGRKPPIFVYDRNPSDYSKVYSRKNKRRSVPDPTYRTKRVGPKARNRDTVTRTRVRGEKNSTWNINNVPVAKSTNDGMKVLGKKWGTGILKDRASRPKPRISRGGTRYG